MKQSVRLKRSIIVVGLACVGLCAVGYGALRYTSLPGVIGTTLLQYAVSGESVKVGSVQGSVWKSLEYSDLELNDLVWFPEGTHAKIQKLGIGINGVRINDVLVNIENARLFLPYSDVVQLDGTVTDRTYSLNLYAPSVSIREILEVCCTQKIANQISGVASQFDMSIAGDIFSPHITGDCVVDTLTYRTITLNNAAMRVDLMGSIMGTPQLTGRIDIREGQVQIRNSTMYLEPSAIIFSGNPNEPALEFNGVATVEKVQITCRIRGTHAKPDVVLTSVPAHSETRLLLMLVTGKSWQQTEQALAHNGITPEVATDFVDYFIFGGAGSVLRKKLGVEEVALSYSEKAKGAHVEKKILGNTFVGYGVEQRTTDTRDDYVAHSVGARVKVTDEVSVSAQKTMVVGEEANNSNGKENGEEKMLLTFKKSF